MRSSDVEGLKPPAGWGRGYAIPVRVTGPPSHVVSASDPPRETDEALEQRSAVIRAAPAEQLLYTKATAPAQIQPPVGHGRGRGRDLTLPHISTMPEYKSKFYDNVTPRIKFKFNEKSLKY